VKENSLILLRIARSSEWSGSRRFRTAL